MAGYTTLAYSRRSGRGMVEGLELSGCPVKLKREYFYGLTPPLARAGLPVAALCGILRLA